MELSSNITKVAKKFGAPVNYIVLADLIALGYSESDAYTIAYPENLALSAMQNKRIRENVIESNKFKLVLEARQERHADEHSASTDAELIDKEQTAKLIMKAAMKQPADSKERIEGLMKYSDLMGYKKNDVDDDSTDTIHFYLPIKCHQCPLFSYYNQFLKEQGEKEIRPVEMEGIIRKAHQSIKKAKSNNK